MDGPRAKDSEEKLSFYRTALADLKADTHRLRDSWRAAEELADQKANTAEALAHVSEKLLEQPSPEAEAEFDELERKSRQLGVTLLLMEGRRLSCAEQVQKELLIAIPALSRLQAAWTEHVTIEVAREFLHGVVAERLQEAEPIAYQLASLTIARRDTEQRFAMKVDGAYAQNLRPLPSAKLDTRLLADPLFRPPDIPRLIKSVLATATSVCSVLEGLLTECGKAADFVVPAFGEEERPVESHLEFNQDLDRRDWKQKHLDSIGKNWEDLSPAEKQILLDAESSSESWKKAPVLTEGIVAES